ncbi:hypothetical protein Tco_0558193 [Tanacetum coccineum]
MVRSTNVISTLQTLNLNGGIDNLAGVDELSVIFGLSELKCSRHPPEHADDEIVAEDQPGAEDASPTAQSPDYMDIDEDDDMDIDADEEDEDDEMDVEVDEEAEEEHPAPAYPVVVALPATAPSAEETEPFETDEWSDLRCQDCLLLSSPTSSPLISMSSFTHILSTITTLNLRAEAADTLFSFSSLHDLHTLPPDDAHLHAQHRSLLKYHYCYYLCQCRKKDRDAAARTKVEVLGQIGFVSTMTGRSGNQGAPVSTDTELGAHVRDFESMAKRDTDEIYTMLDDVQSQSSFSYPV